MTDNSVVALMQEIADQAAAVERHAAAEGHDCPWRAAADVYDRAHHPIMRRLRPQAIVARLREVLP